MRTLFRELLSDRRRAQRGSVLSAVLIMVAFLAILSGALVTELSTNFLLSRNLVNRVANEATVNSAMELALNQLQDTQTKPLYYGCPTLGSVGINSLTALAAYATCWPAIDTSSSQSLSLIPNQHAFKVDGTHSVVPTAGVDFYLNGDANGNVIAISNGAQQRAWTYGLGGEVTATPLAMPDVSSPPNGVLYLVPVTSPTNGSNQGCASACVALLSQNGSGRPGFSCFMGASSLVGSQPAAGVEYPYDAYFGDSSGNLFVYAATASGQCDSEDSASIAATVPGAGAVVAGPFVFSDNTKAQVDEIYVAVSNGSSGDLVHFTYSGKPSPSLNFVNYIPLPGVAVGAAVESTTLPSRIALAFTNGKLDLVQIPTTFTPTSLGQTQLVAGATDAPYWCRCSGANLIGVSAGNSLYVFDTGLNRIASFTAPASITAAPGATAGGDWYVGTSSGILYELQTVAGSTSMIQAEAYAGAGAISAAPLATQCATGICVYMASTDGNMYFAGLDARDAVLDSCITACATGNFSLRAEVEVGVAGSPRTVHVRAWSYYSP